MLRRIIAATGYAAFLLVVVILGTELGLRAYFDDPEYWWDFQYAYITPNAFISLDGLWIYQPNSEIRQVAIYGIPAPKFLSPEKFSVEFDCKFRTNKFGLVGENDQYIESRPTVLVLGDSFTEGQGGCEWMNAVAEEYPDFNVLNGGLQGAGIETFYNLYKFLTRNGVKVTKIVVIAIANDFKRYPYVWQSAELDCLAGVAPCTAEIFWHPIRPGQTHAEMIADAKRRSDEKYPELSELTKLHFWLTRKLYLYAFVSRTFGFYFGNQEARRANLGAAPTKNNIKAMKLLAAAGVELDVILVPQRDEVALRKSNIDTVHVQQFLNWLDINFTRCELSQGDFLPRDAHPNAGGYAKLANCLKANLDEYQKRTAN